MNEQVPYTRSKYLNFSIVKISKNAHLIQILNECAPEGIYPMLQKKLNE